MVLALLLTLFSPAPALADERAEAEHLRLSGELDQLALRQLWAGVDRKFLDLQKLGVDMTYRDLLHGAHASRALGTMGDAYARLKQAAKLDPTKEVIDWMYAIDMNYGQVDLLRTPKKGDVLAVAEPPFDPDQRAAVDRAAASVKDNGTFSGLLPAGNYVFCEQSFTVQPGVAVRIEVSPKMKKTQGLLVNPQNTPTWGAPEPTPDEKPKP